MKTKYVGEKENLRKSPDDLKALIFDIMKSLGLRNNFKRSG